MPYLATSWALRLDKLATQLSDKRLNKVQPGSGDLYCKVAEVVPRRLTCLA